MAQIPQGFVFVDKKTGRTWPLDILPELTFVSLLPGSHIHATSAWRFVLADSKSFGSCRWGSRHILSCSSSLLSVVLSIISRAAVYSAAAGSTRSSDVCFLVAGRTRSSLITPSCLELVLAPDRRLILEEQVEVGAL